MKKVLLTAIGGSSAGTKPISTSILSAVLKAKGHQVVFFDSTFLDLGFPLDGEIADRVLQFKKVDWGRHNLRRDKTVDAKAAFLAVVEREKPDVIAASAMSDMYRHTVEFLKLAKERHPVPAIVGGVHATILPEEVIAEGCVDALCVGEGEEALLEFLDSLEGSTIRRTDIKNLWIKKDGQVFKNPVRPLTSLERLPFLDYSIYDERQFLRAYDGRIIKSGDLQDKRGCPKKCPYCANAILNTSIYPGTRINYYSPERFVEEAKHLKLTYHLEFFKNFSEDILIRPIDDFARMAELYAKEVAVPFTVDTYPLSITEEKAKLLKKMKCASVSVALECGNYHYRKNVLRRDYDNDTFVKRLRILQDAGLRTSTLNMIGLPYESRKMIFETLEVNRRASPSVTCVTAFFPFRGSPLGDLAVRERFVDPELVKVRRSDASQSILSMPQISSDEIKGIRRVCYFYLNYPRFLFPVIRLAEPETPLGNIVFELLILTQRLKVRLSPILRALGVR
ncbi:MAG: radical SAM protein [Elusimicrobia bacterium]|nr:radical SAM protein [Elusimicrobiota bacterium]